MYLIMDKSITQLAADGLNILFNTNKFKILANGSDLICEYTYNSKVFHILCEHNTASSIFEFCNSTVETITKINDFIQSHLTYELIYHQNDDNEDNYFAIKDNNDIECDIEYGDYQIYINCPSVINRYCGYFHEYDELNLWLKTDCSKYYRTVHKNR